jgi:hypothetical protein
MNHDSRRRRRRARGRRLPVAAPALARAMALVALGTLALGAPAAAQIVPCGGASGTGLKVLLDDIFETGAGKVSPLMPSLMFRISANLEQLQVESGLAFKVVRCAKRRPSDPSDFNLPLVEQLSAQQVILELWGSTSEARDASGAPVYEAVIGYVLVPVRFEELKTGPPSGVVLAARQVKSVSSVEEVVRLVDQSGELAAYAAVSAGIRLLRNKEYDRARTQLCRSESLLTRIAGQKPGAQEQALIDHVRRLASDVVSQARADAAYSGVLKALPVSVGGCK